MKKLLIAFLLLVSITAHADIASPSYYWQFGESVYGHQVQWLSDQFWSNDQYLKASIASLSITPGVEVAASYTFAAASTSAPLVFANGSGSYLVAGAGTLYFDGSAVITGYELDGAVNYSGCISRQTGASGSYQVGSFFYGKHLSSDVVDLVASFSNGATGINFKLLASGPIGITVDSLTKIHFRTR